MFHKLKKKLILAYGITTSIVLIAIMCILMFINQMQTETYRRNQFEQCIKNVIEKLETDNSISALWIAQMENTYNVFVYVEENEVPYSLILNKQFMNQYQEKVDEVKRKALGENLNLSVPLIKTMLQQTSIFELKIGRWMKSFAVGAVVPTKDNCISLILIERYQNQWSNIRSRFLLYGLIAIFGTGALFLISTVYIRKVLKPLQIGQQKQVDFVAAASHELRAPLTVIQTGLQAIKEEPEQMDNFMPYLQGECERMTHLISDMLLLATSDAKTWSLNREEIEMDTFMIEIYDVFCCMQKERGSSIMLELEDDELYTISADRERIKQVLTILIDNGWNYTSKEKGLKLKAFNHKNQVMIQVTDYGRGIPDEQKEKVFERFFRGDSSRTDKKHYGLGLSIAKEIVDLHGGQIWVEDTPGGGATFCIALTRK